MCLNVLCSGCFASFGALTSQGTIGYHLMAKACESWLNRAESSGILFYHQNFGPVHEKYWVQKNGLQELLCRAYFASSGVLLTQGVIGDGLVDGLAES